MSTPIPTSTSTSTSTPLTQPPNLSNAGGGEMPNLLTHVLGMPNARQYGGDLIERLRHEFILGSGSTSTSRRRHK